MPDEDDVRDSFIRTALRDGGSFVDVGGLWGTVSEKVSVAAAAGADSVAVLDILALGHPLWARMREHLRDLGVNDYIEVSANLDDPDGHGGPYDVVHCSGVVYHVPNPIHTLRRLFELAHRHLVVTSMVVPELIETDRGTIRVESGQSLLIPALSPSALAIVDRYWEMVGVRNAIGIDVAATYDLDDYGPWWWLPTPSALENWVRLGGFEVEESQPFWGGRSHTVLARRSR